MTLRLPPILPITDRALSGRATHFEIVRELLRGGARMIQVRDKEAPARELLEDLRRSVELARRHGALLVVNDRPDLALLSGAAGVHVGAGDLPPEAARRVLGKRRIVGLSTHGLAEVRASARAPVDYIGFGPIYATSTKQGAGAAKGLAALRRAAAASRKPVVAIGGITLETVPAVLRAGAASAAVISALMRAPDLARAMAAFLEAARARR